MNQSNKNGSVFYQCASIATNKMVQWNQLRSAYLMVSLRSFTIKYAPLRWPTGQSVSVRAYSMRKLILSLFPALVFSCAVSDEIPSGIKVNIFKTMIILPIDLYLVDNSDYATIRFSNIDRSEYLRKGQINTIATTGNISEEEFTKFNGFNGNVDCGMFTLIVHEAVGEYTTYFAFLYSEKKYLRITTTDLSVIEKSLDYYRRDQAYVDSCKVKPIKLR